jgi:hypothetical protein
MPGGRMGLGPLLLSFCSPTRIYYNVPGAPLLLLLLPHHRPHAATPCAFSPAWAASWLTDRCCFCCYLLLLLLLLLLSAVT